nr:hypothetical protein CFP56_05242 [Quercus suber]
MEKVAYLDRTWLGSYALLNQNRLPIDACIGNKGNSDNGFSSKGYSPSLKKSVELAASFEVKSFCLEILGRCSLAWSVWFVSDLTLRTEFICPSSLKQCYTQAYDVQVVDQSYCRSVSARVLVSVSTEGVEDLRLGKKVPWQLHAMIEDHKCIEDGK